ncbi:MAG TPA: phage holin [Firmicutes bacterium]|nr:phage holin [Bacillota bacterium]
MKKDTIVRTIVLALALINQIFALVGIPQLNIDDDTIYQAVTLIVTIVSSVWAWWKNNSFTRAARAADETMIALKNQNK